MICKDTQPDEIRQVSQCHIKAFPASLSSKLGIRFVKRMLSWYIESERGFLFHITENERVVGYVGGTRTAVPGLPGSSTSITQYCFKSFILAFLLKPWLLFHPENTRRFSFIRRNIKLKLGLTGKKMAPVTDSTNIFVPYMGLVVIGVLPEYQGKGYGSVLLKEFEVRAKSEGFSKINLSVKRSNTKAIDAYRRNGWLVEYTGNDELVMYKSV